MLGVLSLTGIIAARITATHGIIPHFIAAIILFKLSLSVRAVLQQSSVRIIQFICCGKIIYGLRSSEAVHLSQVLLKSGQQGGSTAEADALLVGLEVGIKAGPRTAAPCHLDADHAHGELRGRGVEAGYLAEDPLEEFLQRAELHRPPVDKDESLLRRAAT